MRTSGNLLLRVISLVTVGVALLIIGCLMNPMLGLAEEAGANVLFILDGSGSMWGRLDTVEKIVIAKERLSELVNELPENVNIGLMVYGHRSKGDCNDIELMTPVGPGNRERILAQIQTIIPKGKTPITQSIALAAQQLETLEDETSIVLVSDGEETCASDPCAYTKTQKEELAAKGITFTMHVVGFDVNAAQRTQLECIANAGGGRYFSAQNAMQLKAAFTEVKKEVIKQTTESVRLTVNETLWLDTYSPENVGYSGPVESQTILEQGASYLVTIEGTYSAWRAEDTRSFCNGTPEKKPMYPSPETKNGQVSGDAANAFANPSVWPPGCKEKLPRSGSSLRFSLDGGENWFEPEPLDPTLRKEHRYDYKITGQGRPLLVGFVDKPTSDNFGQFKIQLQNADSREKTTSQQEKVYKDTRGTQVRFALGDFSFADEVVFFEKGYPPAERELDMQPKEALGPPNHNEDAWQAGKGGRNVTLGCGGTLVLKFVDNVLIDVEGSDLYIFEVGKAVEPTFVAISKDGKEWVEIGKISGGKASVDISPFVKPGEEYQYVALVDLKSSCGTNESGPGADIDAVGAMGTILKTDIETSTLEFQQPTTFEEFKRQSPMIQSIVKQGELRVGFEAGYMPFEMMDKRGELIGFDIDLAQELAQEMGVKFVPVNTAWDGIIPALYKNEFDIIISGMTITAERGAHVAFSDPYILAGQRVVLNKKHEKTVTSYQDLNTRKYTVTSQRGTSAEEVIKKKLPKCTYKFFDAMSEAAFEVLNGNADAFVYDLPYCLVFMGAEGNNQLIMLDDKLTEEPLGFAIRKGDSGFLEWLNYFLQTIERDGRYEKIYHKWFGETGWVKELD